MSIVAWDGKILAADKMAASGVAEICTKIFKFKIPVDFENGEKLSDFVCAFTGPIPVGMLMVDWFKSGARKKEFPEVQKTDDWSRLIVAHHSFKYGVRIYDNTPAYYELEDPFLAWGAGAEVALGAMAMGADAIGAVGIASRYYTTCGQGIDYYQIYYQ